MYLMQFYLGWLVPEVYQLVQEMDTESQKQVFHIYRHLLD